MKIYSVRYKRSGDAWFYIAYVAANDLESAYQKFTKTVNGVEEVAGLFEEANAILVP